MKPDCRLTRATKRSQRESGLRAGQRGVRLLRGHLGAPAPHRSIRSSGSGAAPSSHPQFSGSVGHPGGGGDIASRLILAELAGDLEGLGWATEAGPTTVLS